MNNGLYDLGHPYIFSGPDVQLGCKAINFMQIDLGETATRTIDIVNNSDIDAVYQVTHAGIGLDKQKF